jgi:hypothetical protein
MSGNRQHLRLVLVEQSPKARSGAVEKTVSALLRCGMNLLTASPPRVVAIPEHRGLQIAAATGMGTAGQSRHFREPIAGEIPKTQGRSVFGSEYGIGEFAEASRRRAAAGHSTHPFGAA